MVKITRDLSSSSSPSDEANVTGPCEQGHHVRAETRPELHVDPESSINRRKWRLDFSLSLSLSLPRVLKTKQISHNLQTTFQLGLYKNTQTLSTRRGGCFHGVRQSLACQCAGIFDLTKSKTHGTPRLSVKQSLRAQFKLHTAAERSVSAAHAPKVAYM